MTDQAITGGVIGEHLDGLPGEAGFCGVRVGRGVVGRVSSGSAAQDGGA